jgi:hypothetical protein
MAQRLSGKPTGPKEAFVNVDVCKNVRKSEEK